MEPKAVHTRLHGPWLATARVAWVALAALALGLFIAGTAVRISEPFPICVNGGCGPFEFGAEDMDVVRDLGLLAGLLSGPLLILFSVGHSLVYFVIAGWIFRRRSDDWIAMLLSITLVILGAAVFTDANDAVQRAYPAFNWLARAVMVFGITSLSFLLFLFPDGRFVPRWTRFVAIAGGVPILLAFVPAPEAVVTWIVRAMIIGILGTGVYARVYRYRRVSSPLQRRQTKWVGLGLMGAIGSLVLSFVAFGAFPAEQPSPERIYFLLAAMPFLLFFNLILPVSVAVAVLRYRLWEIDVIINRTAVYAPLTGILMGLYIASIRLFQALFVRFIGDESDVAILLSTLVLAGAFMPLRLRLQALADKYFKEVPNPTGGLQAFGEQIRSMVQLTNVGQMTRRLLDEVVVAFHAESGAVFMRDGEKLQLAQTSGAWSGTAWVSVSLEHEGEQLGLVSLGSRHHGQEYTPQDREALQQIADVVALSLSLSGTGK